MTTRPMRLAVPLLVVALACTVDNDASIEVYAVCGSPEDAVKCTTTGKCDKLLADRPFVTTLRNGFPNNLELFVQVNNQLPENDDESAFRVNTNDFTIEEYRLSFASNPAMVLPDFVVKANHIVPAEGSTTPVIPLIPFEVMSAIDSQDPVYNSSIADAIVEVELKLFGHTRDGAEIETAPFVVPTWVFDQDFIDPVCVATAEVPHFCPNGGQTASFKCAEP